MEPPILNCLLGCFGWEPTRMARADEQLTKLWLIFIKIIMIIPAGIAAFTSRSFYRFVASHEEIRQSPPFHPRILLAHLLVYVGLMTIFPWLAISIWFLVHKARGSFILIIGLIDFALAIVVAIGVAIQAEYLPASKSGCSDLKAENWQIVGDHKSFFVTAVELGHRDSPVSSCKGFVGDWELAVTCLFCQMLLSYIGIFYDPREASLLNPFRPVWYIILAIVTPIAVTKHQILPRVRFAFITFKNTLRRAGAPKEIVLAKSEQFVPQYQHMISQPMLEQVLHIEHVLLNVVGNMCYEDVINFSMTSRAIREAVYPRRDLDLRTPKLKKYCCDWDTKIKCQYCNKGICSECKVEKVLPGMPGGRHVESCTPYCRACYYTCFSRHPPGYLKPCRCTSMDRAIKVHHMCRTCARRDPTRLQAERHKRYQKEVLDKAYGLEPCEKNGTTCDRCNKELKAGMRWWICGRCRGECRDSIHPAYVRKKDVDIEKAGLEGRM